MSLKLFKDDILFDQRLLSVSGFYKGPLNGIEDAETAFFAEFDKIAAEIGSSIVAQRTRFAHCSHKPKRLRETFCIARRPILRTTRSK
jgi:hypothetical protein